MRERLRNGTGPVMERKNYCKILFLNNYRRKLNWMDWTNRLNNRILKKINKFKIRSWSYWQELKKTYAKSWFKSVLMQPKICIDL